MTGIFNHESAFANRLRVKLRRVERPRRTGRHEHFQVNYCFYAGVFVSPRYHQWLLADLCRDLGARCGIDKAHGVSGDPGRNGCAIGYCW